MYTYGEFFDELFDKFFDELFFDELFFDELFFDEVATLIQNRKSMKKICSSNLQFSIQTLTLPT